MNLIRPVSSRNMSRLTRTTKFFDQKESLSSDISMSPLRDAKCHNVSTASTRTAVPAFYLEADATYICYISRLDILFA